MGKESTLLRSRGRGSRRLLCHALMLVSAGFFASEISSANELRALIEIPAGSSVKYEVDSRTGELVVDRFLPDTLRYPANYGYLPGIPAADGDAFDVLVITSAPVVPGAVLALRVLGMLLMTDGGDEDHKLIAVPSDSVDYRFASVEDIDDLPAGQLGEITTFFSTYKRTPTGANPVELTRLIGRDAAIRIIEQAGSTKRPHTESKR